MATVPDRHYAAYIEKLPSLEGKVVVITGTTSGTGYWTAVCAIRKKAKTLILLNRDSSRAAESLEKLKAEKNDVGSPTELHQIPCDLMSFESVKDAAKEVINLCAESGLHVLANNAGIMAFPDKVTKDGYEVQMQTNHLSHYLLTQQLMPTLMKTVEKGEEVRVSQHSSIARHGSPLSEKYFIKSSAGALGGNGVAARTTRYHQTKLSNVCFALELHNQLEERGIDVTKFKSVVAEPGTSETGLASTTTSNTGFFSRFVVNLMLFYIRHFGKLQSAADGAMPLIEACFGNDVNGGDFFYPQGIQAGLPFKAVSKGKLSEGNKKKEPEVLLKTNQENVWKWSENIFGPLF